MPPCPFIFRMNFIYVSLLVFSLPILQAHTSESTWSSRIMILFLKYLHSPAIDDLAPPTTATHDFDFVACKATLAINMKILGSWLVFYRHFCFIIHLYNSYLKFSEIIILYLCSFTNIYNPLHLGLRLRLPQTFKFLLTLTYNLPSHFLCYNKPACF